MANALQKIYTPHKGLDTRSNKLLMDPMTFRKGSKNWRVNFQDEYQNANGFQHKAENSVEFADIFEYKYKDLNTGESLTQVLAVGIDGHLYRQKKFYLHFVATGAATSYSFFYDEVSDSFKFSMNGIGEVTVSETDTMLQLETALNALTGVTVDILDQDGASASGTTPKAYFLDCVIEGEFQDSMNWLWERVPHPDVSCIAVSAVTIANFDISDATKWTVNSVPFPTTLNFFGEQGYEGISSINYGNSIYITDGGFPMKYDGKCVYRAGMPKSISSNSGGTTITGFTLEAQAAISGTTALTDGNYKYKQRFAFTDFNGATTYGNIIEAFDDPITPFPTLNQNFKISNVGLKYGKDFPIFACKIDGQQGTGSAGGPVTLDVHSGHNIFPGMVIRQYTTIPGPIVSDPKSTSKSFLNFNALVTEVTATTITLQETVCTAGDLSYLSNFNDAEILNGYFTQDLYINKRPFEYLSVSEILPVGAFLQVFRTKVDATDGPFYHVFDMSMPFKNGDESMMIDDKPDSSLTVNFIDLEQGNEIPRACKYLTKWQEQLVQAGRPVDTTIKDDNYPSVIIEGGSIAQCQESIDTLSLYTEALLCDLQSFYWADELAPEGFPQDGLHEFVVETEFSDRITAIATNKDALFAFKERSTGVCTGTLAENDLVLEILEADSGCVSHRTVKEIKGSLVWLDGVNGFFACVAGRLPVNIGYKISDFQKINEEKLDYSQACAANFHKEDLYICSVGSTTFVYDYAENDGSPRNAWYLWDRLNIRGIIETADDEILVSDGDLVWRMKVTNTKYDFTDHKTAIHMVMNTAWLNQEEPIIDKHYLHWWMSSIQGDFTLSARQYDNYLTDSTSNYQSLVFIPESSSKKAVKIDLKCNLPKISAISIGMENQQKNKWVRLQGMELQLSPDYDKGEPKR